MHTHYNLAKICIVGPAGSGKSAIVSRLVKDTFNKRYTPTIGVDFGEKILDAADKTIKLQLWEGASGKDFIPLHRAFFKDAKAFIVTCDMSQVDSLEKTKVYWETIKGNIPNNCPVFLVGTKADLPQKVKTNELENLAKEMSTSHTVSDIVTSANKPAPGQEVSELFEKVANSVALSAVQKSKAQAPTKKPSPSVTASNAGMFSEKSNLRKAVAAFFRALGDFMFYCLAEEIGNSHTTKPKR
jgi:small GTP-binding protein